MKVEILTQLNDAISRSFGIVFTETRLNELQLAIQSICKHLMIKNPEDLVLRIISNQLTDTERNVIIKHLTIGETYFYRDPDIFTGLKDVILPEVIKNKGIDNINIMSVGCSTGEEPYSIAITIQRYMPYIKARIIGLDINEDSIQKAKMGIYKKWSFRNAPKWLMELYFEKTEDNHFEINQQIKECVDFQVFNIADVSKPLYKVFPPMDIVFCRNVIMYFNEGMRLFLADTIYLTLVDNGWLVVSPAEASQRILSMFKTINIPGAILYKKEIQRFIEDTKQCETTQKDNEGIIYQSKILKTPTLPKGDLPKKHIRPVITDKNHIVTKPLVSHRIDTSEILDRAIKNANKGKFEEAEVLLLDIIKVDNLNIDTYFLLASIAEEKKDYQRAEDAIRKIIYINPNHPIAYFRLGNLLIRSGRTEEAKKAFSTALTLFQTVDEDTILQGSDGMHIERLKKICQSMITEINLK